VPNTPGRTTRSTVRSTGRVGVEEGSEKHATDDSRAKRTLAMMATLDPPSEPLHSADAALERSALRVGQSLKGDVVPDVLSGLPHALWPAKVHELREHKEVNT
jgi:hypothetical protein